MSQPSRTIPGILLCAIGIAFLCLMDAVAKALGASMPTFMIVFVRYAGAALWLALYIALTRGAWPLRQNYARHAQRGALMALTACFFFYGVTNLPLAVVAALGMSAPIYVSLFGIVFLKEPVSLGLAGAILLGIAGSIVIVFGGDPIQVSGSSDLLAWGAAILAPMSYAAAIVLMKHHAADEGAATMTLAQSTVAAAVALPLIVPGFAMPAVASWPLIALIGLLGAFGFLFLINGLKRIPASVFAVVDYSALLWAAGFGYLFFSEVPELRLWIGGGLIIAACALGFVVAQRREAAAA